MRDASYTHARSTAAHPLVARPWRLSSRGESGNLHRVVFRFPDSAEVRELKRVPEPGSHVRSSTGEDWIVEEVLQSGIDTYTVFCVGRREFREEAGLDTAAARDLADELVGLARRSLEAAAERRRRWRARKYIP
jgi:hypothetical protein